MQIKVRLGKHLVTYTATGSGAGSVNAVVDNVPAADATAKASITVTPTNTIAAGVNRTTCINTAITSITLATTGATGANFGGLPAGVTGSWAGNVVTISGTPTASGTFNYTVTTIGGCPPATATGTITVNALNTITLTSVAGTDNQSVPVNTPITNITYGTTGATGATFTGLPAGVSGSWAGNIVTITGSPSTIVGSPFSYTVSLTGGCGSVTATGTITVTSCGATLTSAAGTNAQLACINNPITNIVYSTTSATGATFAGLPAGITGTWSASVITISGTPTTTVGSPFNYTITLTGGTCAGETVTGTITVNALPIVSITGPNSICAACSAGPGTTIYTAILNGPAESPSNASPGTGTATITVNTVTNTMRVQCTFSGLTGSTTASHIHSATAVANTGTAGVATTTPTFAGFPIGVTSGTYDNTLDMTLASSYNPAYVTANGGTTASAFAALQAGLSANQAYYNIHSATFPGGEIRGFLSVFCSSANSSTTLSPTSGGTWISSNPAVATVTNAGVVNGVSTGTATFTFTNTGTSCSATTLAVTVNPSNTVTAASSTPTVCINTPLINITHTTTGATGIGTALGLPAGVTAAWASNTITISGTPTVSGVFNYTIPLTGGCGGISATGTITVSTNNTAGAASSSPTVCINTVMPGITHTTTGATGIGAPSNLPAGVTASFGSNTITISGTPTASGTFNYSIPLTGGCGTVNATGTITVSSNNIITLTSGAGTNVQTIVLNQAMTTPITYSTTGATGATFIGLPPGVTGSWAANVVTISGTPTSMVGSPFNYTVTLTGGCGTVTATGTLTVVTCSITLTSAAGTNAQTVCNNAPITNIIYTTTTATGATFAGLPAGITGAWAANVVTISGSSAASGTFTYTVTATGGGCVGVTATGTITINPVPDVSQPANQVVCNNTATAAVNFTGSVLGTIFNWTNNQASIGLTASGTGNIASFIATNGTTAPVIATVTVTPSTGGGNGIINGDFETGSFAPWTLLGNVPPPLVNNLSPHTGTYAAFLGTPGGGEPLGDASFYQQFTVPAGGGTLSYWYKGFTTDDITFDWQDAYITNTSNTVLATIMHVCVTTGGYVNVTYNMAAFAGQTVRLQFLVHQDGFGDQTDMYIDDVTLPGGITCIGTPTTFTYTVNPTPTVNAVSNQAVCNGTLINAVNFSGAVPGTVFNWNNNTPSIGLAGSGSGNMGAFIATNATNAPVVATITVTPSYTNAGTTCTGTPITFTITVNPTPDVAQPANQVVCNGAPTAPVVFTGSVAGTIFNWTNNTTSIGLAASGTGNIASFTATNASNAPIVATITVTPTTSNVDQSQTVNTTCMAYFSQTNLAQSFKPAANALCGARVYIESGAGTGNITIQLYSNLPNAGGVLLAQGTATGIAAGQWASVAWPSVAVTPGSTYYLVFTSTNGALCVGGDIGNPYANGQVYANAGYQPFTTFDYTFETFTCQMVACPGTAKTFTITANPTPIVNAVANQVVCNNSPTVAVVFTTPTTGGTVTYSWTNNTTSIGLAASGTGNIASFTATNATAAPLVATITVTPSYTNGGTTCTGSAITFTITVNPTATVNPVPNQVLCNGANSNPVNFSSPTTGGTIVYNWTNNQPSIGLGSSGIGNIPTFVAVNVTNVPVVATITVTPTYTNGSVSCVGTPITFTITVNPPPIVNPVANQVVCTNSSTAAVIFSTPTTGGVAVYNWTNNNTSIGLGASGTGNIPSFTGLNPGTGPNVATITVIMTYISGGISCVSLPVTFTITVNPVPVVNPVANQRVCNGSPTAAVNFTSPNTGGTVVYNWTNTGAFIGLGPNGVGNIPSFIATNPGTVPLTATIMVTPTYTGSGVSCTGPSITFTITVNPSPTVNQPANQVLCNGSPTAPVIFTGSISGTIYSWVNNNTSIGLGGGADGNIASFIAINTGTTVQVATITVTPSYTNGGVTCSGTPVTFTITVNPIPVVNAVANQTVCAGTITTANFTGPVAGTVYSWTNSNIGIGLGSTGTGNINFVATNTTGAPITGTITVTPVFTNGGVSCSGTSITFTITVNPVPVVNPVASQTLCNSSPTAAVTFTGPVAGTVYTWTNNNTTIGLGASGTGNIASFIATNATNAAVTATITVTPSFTSGNTTCTGTPVTFTITVNPTPSVNAIANQVVCNGSSTTTVTITGTVAGTVYSWTNNNTSIGLVGAGTGNIAAFVGLNNTNVPVVATITVTPTYTNGGVSCSGASITFTITVNPSPNVNRPANQILCNGSATTAINFTGTVAGTVYNWTNTNTSIGLAASGTGNIASFIATNITNTVQTATITVTPSAAGCVGVPVSFTITVNPTPKVTQPANQTVCAGNTTAPVNFTGSIPGTVFTWTNNNTTIGLGESGTGNIPAFITINPTINAVIATITVTPTYTNGTVSCSGTPVTFTITVVPQPNIIFTNMPPSVCLTDTLVNLATKATPAGGTWSGPGVTGNTFSAAATGVGVKTLSYTFTNSNGCTAISYVNVVVNDCKERHNIFATAIRIYPNPSSGLFNIRFLSDIYTEFNVSVVTADGKELRNYHFDNLRYGSVIPMDLRILPGGTYFLQIYNASERAYFPFVIVR